MTSCNRSLCSAFTLPELLAVIGIIGLLAALIVSGVLEARGRAQTATCLSNLRGVGAAVAVYAQDYDGTYPAAITTPFVRNRAKNATGTLWYDTIAPYTKQGKLACPSRLLLDACEERGYPCGYGLNKGLNDRERGNVNHRYTGRNESALQAQSAVVMVFETRTGIFAGNEPDEAYPDKIYGIYAVSWEKQIRAQIPGAVRHHGGANYAFADGHAKWLRPDALVRDCGDGTKPCFKP